MLPVIKHLAAPTCLHTAQTAVYIKTNVHYLYLSSSLVFSTNRSKRKPMLSQALHEINICSVVSYVVLCSPIQQTVLNVFKGGSRIKVGKTVGKCSVSSAWCQWMSRTVTEVDGTPKMFGSFQSNRLMPTYKPQMFKNVLSLSDHHTCATE